MTIRTFYCSWENFRCAKEGKPVIQFSGRFLQTEDLKLADHIIAIAKTISPMTIKEIPASQFGQEPQPAAPVPSLNSLMKEKTEVSNKKEEKE